MELLKKIGFLESMRGIGALMVILFHYLEIFYPAFVTGNPAQAHLPAGVESFFYSTPLRLLVNGPAAVTLFFLISGFVLTFKFFSKQDTQILASAAVRRYFRLLPVVLAVELLAYLCLRFNLYAYTHPLPGLTLTKSWLDAYWTPADLGKVLYEAFAGTFVAYQNQYDVPLWTMTYEFLGSLLVIAVAWLGSKVRYRWVVYAAALIYFRSSYYSAFLLGMILSDLTQQPGEPLHRWIPAWLNPILGLAGLFLLSFPAYTDFADKTLYGFMHYRPLENYLVIYYYTWGGCLLLLSILNSRRLQALLNLRPFIYLGSISYPVYAVHYLVLGSLSAWLFVALHNAAGYPAAFLITFTVSVAVIWAAAVLLQRYVDTPGASFANWIYARFFQPAPAPAPAAPRPAAGFPERVAEFRDPPPPRR